MESQSGFNLKFFIHVCLCFSLVCLVQEVDVDAFKDLKILVELDLSHNNLTSLMPGTFSGNDRLQTLSLSHNKLSELHPFQFPRLMHLRSLDLSANAISGVDSNALVHLGDSVETISLDHNELRTLREDVFLPLARLVDLKAIYSHLFSY